MQIKIIVGVDGLSSVARGTKEIKNNLELS
jgi:hypothetical protein